MPRIVTIVSLLILCASHARAFDGGEHRLVTDVAFAAALDVTPASEAMATAVRERTGCGDCLSFGDVTLAVDWFQSPDNLLDPAALQTELTARHRNIFKRGLAAHNNTTHFQEKALEQWLSFHEQARKAASEHPREALLLEAVALHYLQDFFSAGHLVTPRDGLHDAVAGHLHDSFNDAGIEFVIAASIPPEMHKLLDVLSAPERLGAQDSQAFLEARGKKEQRFHGDGALQKSHAQRMFVALISALSVREVLAASTGQKVPGLQPCFALRQAAPLKKERETSRPSPDFKTIVGPDGGILLADLPEPGLRKFVPRCEGSAGAWLGRYEARADPKLTQPEYSISGATVRGEVGISRRGHDLRFNTDILFFVLAEDRRLMNSESGKPYMEGKGLNRLLLGTAGLSLSRGNRYNSVGVLYDYLFATRYRPLTWAIRLAPRRYGYGDTHPWRSDIGVKAGLGFDVVNITASIERAHDIAPDGKFGPEYFAMVGAEVSLAPRWAAKVAQPLLFWRRGNKVAPRPAL